MQKLPYSRLLDPEFLNAGGRERGRAVKRGARRVLSSWSWPGQCAACSTLLQVALLFALLLSVLLTLIVYLSSVPDTNNQELCLIVDEGVQDHNGVPLAEGAEPLPLPLPQVQIPSPAPHHPQLPSYPQLRKLAVQAVQADPALLKQIPSVDLPRLTSFAIKNQKLLHALIGDHDDHNHGAEQSAEDHAQHSHGDLENLLDHEHHGPLQRERTPDLADHHFALAGGFHDPAEHDHDHDGVDGEHLHFREGDVVLQDHHIVDAGASDLVEVAFGARATRALLLCQRAAPATAPVPAPAPNPAKEQRTAPTNTSQFLTRAQLNVAYSTIEFLGDAYNCHVVILDTAERPSKEPVHTTPEPSSIDKPTKGSTISDARVQRTSNSTSSPRARRSAVDERSSTPVPTSVESVEEAVSERHNSTAESPHTSQEEVAVNCTQPPWNKLGFKCPPNDTFSGDSEGWAGEQELVLANGKRLGLVRRSADQLFRGSPFGSSWRRLADRSGTDLLALAARLLLVWGHGGVSVDLQATTDRALKTLNLVNRTNPSHVYLETTHATVLAAPQSCNAVVFELIDSMSKKSHELAKNTTRSNVLVNSYHADDGDVFSVFDGVLKGYCKPRLGSPRPRTRRAPMPPPDEVLHQDQPATPISRPREERIDRTVCRGDIIALSFV